MRREVRARCRLPRLAGVLTILPLAALGQTIGLAVLPGLGSASTRTPVDVDVDVAPWRAVVRVQTEIGGACTGALVGPRTVLTAAHCVFAPGTGARLRPGSIHVLVGYERGRYAGHGRATLVVTGPGFRI